MDCPKCGYKVPEGVEFSFCPKCGSKIPEAAPPPPPPQAPPVAQPSLQEAILPQMQKLKDEIGAPEPVSIKKRILIVEDDLFIRELYQKQLEMAGYSVDLGVDGLEGREKVMNNAYDLLLLDIMLPRMNGLDLLRNIKEDPKTKDIPVIILSNLGQDAVIEKGLSLGAVSYIVKADITPLEMLRVIQERIGK